MAIGLLTAHAGLLEIAVSTFILNSRHLFFGLSLLTRYRATGLKKFYLIFGLTALFMVLVIEQWKKIREPFPFIVAGVCALVVLLFVKEQMLLVAIGLSIIVLALRYRSERDVA